jgi:hypothetical protein
VRKFSNKKLIASYYNLINSCSLNNPFLWGGNLPIEGNQWWGFPWGGVWGRKYRQTFVVCRYEEDPAGEVSLVVKQRFHGRETYPGWVLRVSSMFFIISGFFSYDFDVTTVR